MLKSIIFFKENIDVSKFLIFNYYLKRQMPKKSCEFIREHIKKFLNETSDISSISTYMTSKFTYIFIFIRTDSENSRRLQKGLINGII